VSAYLHSATMVKAGVFLLARLYPALGGSEPWFWIVTLTGLATLVVGAYIAIFKHDLKGLLAYSTISHLGLITLLFGLDEPLAVVAAVFHIINHATFKAGLFMSAGIIDHETGSRDMRQLNGLMKYMPFTATLGIVAASAMAGVPLLNGFLSKEMFFAEAVAKEGHGVMEWVLPAGATLVGSITHVVSGSRQIGATPVIALRFDHLVAADGKQIPISGELDERGASERGRDTAKILGGAAAGAVIGNQSRNNDRGRLIGALVGGAIGAIAAKNTGTEVSLQDGAALTIALDKPFTVTPKAHAGS
jgi:multicomponent K+:H+ antiporter subunit A